MKYITVTLVNLSILSLAYAGINIDDRFLALYQFVMWSFVLLAIISLFLPSKDLFKGGNDKGLSNIYNWFFSIIKVFVSVWVGMSVLAAFYLTVTILCFIKKKAYFEDLTNNKEE